jgi:hypothetical protein
MNLTGNSERSLELIKISNYLWFLVFQNKFNINTMAK